MPLQSFPEGFRALVIGASGGIGAALIEALRAEPRCASVIALGRATEPALDLPIQPASNRPRTRWRGRGRIT